MSRRPRSIFAAAFVAIAVWSAAPVATFAQSAATADVAGVPSSGNLDLRPIRRAGEERVATTNPTTTTSAAALGHGASLGFDIARMIAALLIVLAMIGMTYWIVRRFFIGTTGVASTRVVKVLSRTPLAPRQQVMLIQVGRRIVVVGESAGALTTLSQIDDADEVAQLLGQLESDQMRRAASFGGVFGRTQKAFEPSAANDDAGTASVADDDADGVVDEPPRGLAEHRSELAGLLDKVRSLRGEIGK